MLAGLLLVVYVFYPVLLRLLAGVGPLTFYRTATKAPMVAFSTSSSNATLPILASLAFDLPNIWYFELWPSRLFYLWPSMPPLLLAKTAFLPVESPQLVYAIVYGTLVVCAALFWASRSIDRFVVRGEFAS